MHYNFQIIEHYSQNQNNVNVITVKPVLSEMHWERYFFCLNRHGVGLRSGKYIENGHTGIKINVRYHGETDYTDFGLDRVYCSYNNYHYATNEYFSNYITF